MAALFAASITSLAATCGTSPALTPLQDPFRADPVEASPAPAAPAGTQLEGVYHDGSYPFSIPVGEGWVVREGRSDAPLRVVLEHVSTGTTLEVWVFHEDSSAPRPRSGCRWTFSDHGAYQQLRSPHARTVATCVPDDPERELVLGTTLVRESLAYHFELLVPPGRLLQARRAAEDLLQGVAFY